MTSQYYAITSKYVAAEWPVQFLEEAVDSTGTRKGLICSLLSLFQMFKDKPVPGAVYCPQERAESILAEEEDVFILKSRVPIDVSEYSCPPQFMSAQSGVSPHLNSLHDVVFVLL